MTKTMTKEEKRKEVQKQLSEEERVRQLETGGGEMRAQLAMEEGERSAGEGTPRRESYLVSEEEAERRRITGTGDPYRGYGETQRAEMAMWDTKAEKGEKRSMTEEEMVRTGSARVGYESGRGSYYSEFLDRPIGTTGPESSFGRNERTPSGRTYAEGAAPYQPRMSRDEMMRQGSDSPLYRSGSGTYYDDTFEKSTGTAGPESSFGRVEGEPRGRRAERGMTDEEMRRTGSDNVDYPAGTGSYYSETFERPTGTTGPESSFGRTERTPSGRQYAEQGPVARPDRYQKRMSDDEMMAKGTDSPLYRSGSGTYYDDTFERPTSTTGPESSFGRVEGEPRARRGQGMSQDEMRRSGSDQVGFPAGSGSYYSETFEKPSGTAGPESSFGRTERMPSGRMYAEGGQMATEGRPAPSERGMVRASGVVTAGAGGAALYESGRAQPPSERDLTEASMKREGAASGQQSTGAQKMGEDVMARSKAAGGTMMAKTKEVTSSVSGKAKEYTEGTKVEESAHKAGLAIGGALRKAATVAREMGEGLRKGLSPEKDAQPPKAAPAYEPAQQQMAAQTPTVEDKARKKQNP